MMSAVGDAVLVSPVITALRRAYPDVHLSWILQPGPHSLVAPHPGVDEFILFHRNPRGRSPLGIIERTRAFGVAARALRESARRRPEGRFDVLLDLQVYFKAGLMTALTPARVKLGFDRRRARDLNWVFTSHRIPPRPGGFGHIQDQYFEFLRYLGVDPSPVEYGLHPTEAEKEAQGQFFGTLDRPAAALVVASSDPRKNWSPEGLATVASRIHAEFDLQPILVGGCSPPEEEMAAVIMDRAGGVLVDARGGGLRRLLWLLDGAALVVSPDTGPLHMARAVNTPVVGLFGFTNPKRSGPYGRFTDLVVDGYARSPGEAYPLSMERRPRGMGRISPEMVLEKVALAQAYRTT